MDTPLVNVTENKCSIGILSIFDTVFQYLPIFLMVLRYWVPPKCSPPPSMVLLSNFVTFLYVC